ncbi:apolipoprotein N-acyltransferase [Actinomyces vulturis]|uniref:apolipoprotein N-acyltransferase n=1 Tax=Actinomyces vulturis TaxID=1857645 RepID=UPI00159EC775|nr:apolipoprotein N-acyltransferase [Actinomyces vulturis]
MKKPATMISSRADLPVALVGGLITAAAFPAPALLSPTPPPQWSVDWFTRPLLEHTDLVGRWWWVLIGLAIWTIVGYRRSVWRGLGNGFVFGLGYFAPLLHFTATSMGSPIGWIALSIVQALYVSVAGGVWSLASRAFSERSSVRQALIASLIFTSAEVVRSLWPLGGMPWARVAFALPDAPMVRVASLGGSVLLSLVATFIATLLGLALIRLKHWHIPSAAFCIILGATVAFAPLMIPIDSRPQNGTIKVALVQGNVATDTEAAFARAREVTTNHVNASSAMLASPDANDLDVVIWPENAADLDPRRHADIAQMVTSVADQADVPVLVGSVLYDNDTRYNDLVVWEPGTTLTTSVNAPFYRKHHPVPFGEYVPYRSFLQRFVPDVERIGVDMSAGDGPATLTFPAAHRGDDVTAAVGICFEVAYDSILRRGVNDGGEFLIVPTNNASFLYSSEASQQLAMGRIQAVIHSRAVAQVSTVGITALITPSGVVTQDTQPYTADFVIGTIPLRTSITLADQLGNWPEWVVATFGALILVTSMIRIRH